MMRPLAIDLFAGLGGWTDGLLAEGYYVVGFDIERHVYGEHRYSAQLVLQDVLTLHGSQFKDAALIVASPPCQAYSWRAMPWKAAKAAPPPDNTLFEACFRIQREACEAAGRHIPLVVENVRGAQKWVGRARWNFGSYYLWGDTPALMPIAVKAAKVPGFRFDGSGRSFQTASVAETGNKNVGPHYDPTTGGGAHGMMRWTNPAEGFKSQGLNWSDPTKRGQDFTRIAGMQRQERDGIKNKDADGYERSHPHAFGWKIPRTSSAGQKRKFASAMIAKIPFVLSSHVARSFLPRSMEKVA